MIFMFFSDNEVVHVSASGHLTFTRVADHLDHFKKVICRADHPASQDGSHFEWSRNLDIRRNGSKLIHHCLLINFH